MRSILYMVLMNICVVVGRKCDESVMKVFGVIVYVIALLRKCLLEVF